MELWGSLFMNLGPFQQILLSKRGTIFESVSHWNAFPHEYFISGNGKAIQVSIFLRNILTFVSKHFFNLKIDYSEKEKKKKVK